MIIYNPHNKALIEERAKEAERLLQQLPARYCFITGSFLFKEDYRDIDIFVISRSKKEFSVDNKKAKITVIDFNDLYSLFYHSITKSCVAKELLPMKPLKVTVSDFWSVINEAVPTILNRKEKYHKDIRFLVLYTEFFRSDAILDTFELDEKIKGFKDYKDILSYIKDNLPAAIKNNMSRSYIRRFFYTQAGHYKDITDYPAQSFLYALTHEITRGAVHD
jgi:hypothetical protein